MPPRIVRAIIIVPNEIELLVSALAASVYDRTVNGGGGVKVGKRVFVGAMLNCAASAGSIVEVAGGTGVGGGAMIRNVPGETCTSGEYTQPELLGAPGYSIWIQSPPCDLPSTGAVEPVNSVPTIG
jgi:hypothetical protein